MDPGTRRNFITYYLNFIVMAAVGFIVNPLLLSALGPLLFGVWKSLQRYLDFATVADGRATQALKWIVASRTDMPDDERRRDVGAAIIVWLRWLPAAAVVAVGVTLAVPLLIKGLPEDVRTTAFTTAAILAANTVLAGLLWIPDSVLTGVNQGYKSMLVTTATLVASNAAMIVVAVSGWPLWSLAVVVLAGAVGNAAFTLFVVRGAVPWWGVMRPTRADLRRVMGYSAWTLGWVVVDKLFLASELVVISAMVGAVAVTQYTFTTYVMQFVITIALVTASGFMPLLGSQIGASQLRAAAERTRAVRHLVIGVAVVGSCAVLALNGAVVTAWVGEGQYFGATLNALLVVCGLQLALIRMDGQILDVTMRIGPKVVVGLLSSAGGIASGCIAYAATRSLIAALLTVIALRLLSNIAFPILVSRSIPDAGVSRRVVMLSIVCLIVSLGVGPFIQAHSTAAGFAVVAAWIAFVSAAAWFGLLPRATVRAIFARRSSS